MKSIKIYAEVLEDEALAQFNEAMSQPEVIKGALMPDAHTGYVLPIGAVVAVKDKVFPSYVGYDIGCGMCAAKLDIKASDIDRDELFLAITKNIPVGFAKHDKNQIFNIDLPHTDMLKNVFEKRGAKQLGTLGGGNHFIEVGEGKDGFTWVIIHSGSRGLGHGVAEYYMKLAMHSSLGDFKNEMDQFDGKNKIFKDRNPEKFSLARQKHYSNLVKAASKNIEGHYGFDVNSESGKDYIKDMNYCLEFALENRKRMIDKIVDILSCTKTEFINRNHNHAEQDKDGLWIHRKGATHAEDGMLGVIPGNMRDGCFIVSGKGNKDSMSSSSHGAGRVLSRKKAKELLSMDNFKETMDGIIGCVDMDRLDEAPDAYKNIFEVMELQKELVDIIDYIKPIVNVKG